MLSSNLSFSTCQALRYVIVLLTLLCRTTPVQSASTSFSQSANGLSRTSSSSTFSSYRSTQSTSSTNVTSSTVNRSTQSTSSIYGSSTTFNRSTPSASSIYGSSNRMPTSSYAPSSTYRLSTFVSTLNDQLTMSKTSSNASSTFQVPTPNSFNTTQTSMTSDLSHSASLPSSIGGYLYTGCYSPVSDVQLLSGSFNDIVNTTATSCAAICLQQYNSTMFAVRNGSTCICTNFINPGVSYMINESACNMPCAGNATETCGGSKGYSLYSRFLEDNTDITIQRNAGSRLQYLGCYLSHDGLVNWADWSLPTIRLGIRALSREEACRLTCLRQNPNFVTFSVNINICRCGVALGPLLTRYPSISRCGSYCNRFNCSLTDFLYNSVYTAKNTQSGLRLPLSSTTWNLLGCYTNGRKALSRPFSVQTTHQFMTVAVCRYQCSQVAENKYFGVLKNSCFCAISLEPTGRYSTSASECNLPCSGDSRDVCGGLADRISVYQRMDIDAPDVVKPKDILMSGFQYAGSYTFEDTSDAGLNQTVSDTMTVPFCDAFCSASGNYTWFGLKNGWECYCNDGPLYSSHIQADLGDYIPCSGNASQPCGGSSSFDMYQRRTGNNPTSTTSTAPGKTTNRPSTKVSVIPRIGDYSYQGCYTDYHDNALGLGFRVMSYYFNIEACYKWCSTRGWTFFGLKKGTQCICGNALDLSSIPAKSAGECNIRCGGSSTQWCGGQDRLTLYSKSIAGPSIASPWSLLAGSQVGEYSFMGCYATSDDDNPLFNVPYGAMLVDGNMRIGDCHYACAKNRASSIFALRNGNECICANYFDNTTIPATGCNLPCPGNTKETCGGLDRLQVYSKYTNLTSSLSPNDATPVGSSYVGCFSHTAWQSARKQILYDNSGAGMTVNACPVACALTSTTPKDLTFGVSDGSKCWCSQSLPQNSSRVDEAFCKVPCEGNPLESCGGLGYINIYRLQVQPTTASLYTPSTTSTLSSVTGYTTQGGSVSTRRPVQSVTTTSFMTIDPFISDTIGGCDTNRSLSLCQQCQMNYENFLAPLNKPVTSYMWDAFTFNSYHAGCRSEFFTGTELLTRRRSDISTCFSRRSGNAPISAVTYDSAVTARPYYDPGSVYAGHASSPCCGQCTVVADTVEVIFFPPDADYSTAVIGFGDSDMTLYSPTVYLQFQTLYASNLCSHLTNTIASTIIGVDPSHLTTINLDDAVCGGNTRGGFKPWNVTEVQAWGDICANMPWERIPHREHGYYQNMAFPVSGISTNTTASCDTVPEMIDLAWQKCNPRILVPDEVYSLQPGWSNCVRSGAGLAFDSETAAKPGHGFHQSRGKRSPMTYDGQENMKRRVRLKPLLSPTTIADAAATATSLQEQPGARVQHVTARPTATIY